MNTIWLAFLTGLTTGGISCFAVQGGVLTSAVSQDVGEDKSPRTNYVGVLIFLLSKLIAYIIVGAILGAVGATLQFSPKIMGVLQIAVGLFMLATAARLIELHPIFRYTVITPPRWVYKVFHKQSHANSIFAPALMGALTILMPCGVTQAMMVAALSSGSITTGALTMGAFVLGTSPVFFALGAAFVVLLQKKVFTYIAAVIVCIFGLMAINGGLALTGSIYTFQNFYRAAVTPVQPTSRAIVGSDGVSDVTIIVHDTGYDSDTQILQVGVPVRLHLKTDNVKGCSRSFVIPSENITKVLPASGEEIITFTPTKTGSLTYSCSMGMYTGEFTVVQ